MLLEPTTFSSQQAKALVDRLQENPTSPVIINVSELLISQGKQDKALKHLLAVKNIYSNSYRYNLVLARTYKALNDSRNAKTHYEIACQLAPQNEVALKELALLISHEYQPTAVPLNAGTDVAEAGQETTENEIIATIEPSGNTDLFLDESEGSAIESTPKEDDLFVGEPSLNQETPIPKPEPTTQTDELFTQESVEAESSSFDLPQQELTADELFMNQNPEFFEEEAGELEDVSDESPSVDIQTIESSESESPSDVLFSDAEPEKPEITDDLFSEVDSDEQETTSDLFIEPSEKSTAPEVENSDALFSDAAPQESKDFSEMPKPQELPELPDLSELSDLSDFSEEYPEPEKPQEPQNQELVQTEEVTEEVAQPDDAGVEKPSNIFEPDEKSIDYNDSDIEDLFIPDDDTFGLDRVGDIASHDLLPSTINAEQLQREAIRMIEEEMGPIGFDPFQDYEATPEAPESQPEENDLSDLPPITSESFSDSSKHISQSFPEESVENSDPASSLFSDESTDENPGIENTEEYISHPELPDLPTFETNDIPEQAIPKVPAQDDDYDLDFDDDFEFKIDKNRLAQALSKLGESKDEPKQQTQPEPAKNGDDIEDLASSLSEAKFMPIEETEEPTSIKEQRAPFDDDEEIKTPTLSLAKIFYSQGAYQKAINVYRALIQKDPENIANYEKAINDIQKEQSGS